MKILFTPYSGGSIAHIVRSLAVADCLLKRGHEILFTSTTSKREFVRKAGYEVYGDGHPDVNLNDENDQTISYFKNNRHLFIAWMRDEIRAADDFRPDILVNSPNFMGTPAGSLFNIPYISIINAQWLMEYRGLLGIGKSKNHIGHQLFRKVAKPIFSYKFEKFYMKEVISFYNELKIPRVPRRRIHIHNSNPAIIPGIPEFEPLERTKRTNLHYVGPLFWQGFEQAAFEPSYAFSDISPGRPFIYISLGGSIFRKQSYEELIGAFAKKTEWNILLSLGPNFSREDFKRDMPHFAIRTYVAGLKTCQYADVIVNTGSHGTVMQALWNGKPVIAIPHNIDQGSIAARLVELKIGANLNPINLKDFSNRGVYFEKATQISWAVIMKEIEKVLHDPQMKRNAECFGSILRSYSSRDEKAADLIEKYASKNHR